MQTLSSLKEMWTQEFVMLLVERNLNAFETLYNTYVDILYRYITATYGVSSDVAKDIVADTFVKVRENLPSLVYDTTSHAWIWTICRNTAIDTFKKKSSRSFGELAARYDVYTDEYDIEDVEGVNAFDIVDATLSYEYLISHIDALDPGYKDVLHFRYGLGYSYKEIASIMNESESVIRQRCSRGVRTIRQQCNLG